MYPEKKIRGGTIIGLVTEPKPEKKPEPKEEEKAETVEPAPAKKPGRPSTKK